MTGNVPKPHLVNLPDERPDDSPPDSWPGASAAADDRQLWRQLLAGDAVAFERLMLGQFRLLFHYGLRFSADPEFVKDTIQDVFLYVWEHRDNLNADIPPKPYLMASLRRMMHRAALRKPPVSEPLSAVNPPPLRIEFSVEKHYITRETSRRLSQQLKSTLDQLPPRQKEVIYLKYYQEMSRPQIAAVMDIAPQTVSNLLQMALGQLRKYWKSESVSPLA